MLGSPIRGTWPKLGNQKDIPEDVMSYLSLERCIKHSQATGQGKGGKAKQEISMSLGLESRESTPCVR